MAFVFVSLLPVFFASVKPIVGYRLRFHDFSNAETAEHANMTIPNAARRARSSAKPFALNASYDKSKKVSSTFSRMLEADDRANATSRSKSDGTADAHSHDTPAGENGLSTSQALGQNVSSNTTNIAKLQSAELVNFPHRPTSKSVTEQHSRPGWDGHGVPHELNRFSETSSSEVSQPFHRLHAIDLFESSTALPAKPVQSGEGPSLARWSSDSGSIARVLEELSFWETFAYAFAMISLGICACLFGCFCCCIFAKSPPRYPPVRKSILAEQHPISISQM
eukprot:TRINITY_DN24808_c0_g2_i1.p1 TRINITY_DN24808_c0_g2~~TRINITY_DN24808_c0_g2_i1.p1  ORF type:complete len:297 (+),score=25.07 TRINITY_DN24808_c0_g2_i1:52-891(+)